MMSVKNSNRRAENLGLPATLTEDEWQKTMDHFGGKCAYCKTAEADIIEHFVPLARGGGTTPGNCLPACGPCNTEKSNLAGHPLKLRFGCQLIIELSGYLSERSTTTNVVKVPSRGRTRLPVEISRETLADLQAIMRTHNVRPDIGSAIDYVVEWYINNRKDVPRG
jgi:hypothetical protein